MTFYIYSPYFHQVAGSGDDVPVKNISNGQRVTIVSGVPWGFWGTPSCGVFQMLKSHINPRDMSDIRIKSYQNHLSCTLSNTKGKNHGAALPLRDVSSYLKTALWSNCVEEVQGWIPSSYYGSVNEETMGKGTWSWSWWWWWWWWWWW